MNKIMDSLIEKKLQLINTDFKRYALRAVYSGLYLTIGSAIALVLGDYFGQIHPVLGKFMNALFFPWGLIAIIILNAELATSNMMYYTYAVYRHKMTVKEMIKILVVCSLFNLFASVLVAWFLSQTSVFNNISASHYLFESVNTKLTKPIITVFIEGIFANILVNIAILGTVRIKENSAKILFVIGIIFIFVFLGFEHVVANFGSFTLAFFANPTALINGSLSQILIHWGVTFIANYIGGGLVIGLGYAYLNQTQTIYLD